MFYDFDVVLLARECELHFIDADDPRSDLRAPHKPPAVEIEEAHPQRG
jgi:hypothetical protein